MTRKHAQDEIDNWLCEPDRSMVGHLLDSIYHDFEKQLQEAKARVEDRTPDGKYCPECYSKEDEHGITTHRLDCSFKPEFIQETISITDEQGKVYEFYKPKWWNDGCELSSAKHETIIGWCDLEPTSWGIDGNCITIYNTNLTPIKPKWYENESNFPCLIRDKINPNNIVIAHTNCFDTEIYRPATKEEALTLVVED